MALHRPLEADALVVFLDLDASLHQRDMPVLPAPVAAAAPAAVVSPSSQSLHPPSSAAPPPPPTTPAVAVPQRLSVVGRALRAFFLSHAQSVALGQPSHYALQGVWDEPAELLPLTPAGPPARLQAGLSPGRDAVDAFVHDDVDVRGCAHAAAVPFRAVVAALRGVAAELVERHGVHAGGASVRGVVVVSRAVAPSSGATSGSSDDSAPSAATADATSAATAATGGDKAWAPVPSPRPPLPLLLDVLVLAPETATTDGGSGDARCDATADALEAIALADAASGGRYPLASFSVTRCKTGLDIGKALTAVVSSAHHAKRGFTGSFAHHKVRGAGSPSAAAAASAARWPHRVAAPTLRRMQLMAPPPPPEAVAAAAKAAPASAPAVVAAVIAKPVPVAATAVVAGVVRPTATTAATAAPIPSLDSIFAPLPKAPASAPSFFLGPAATTTKAGTPGSAPLAVSGRLLAAAAGTASAPSSIPEDSLLLSSSANGAAPFAVHSDPQGMMGSKTSESAAGKSHDSVALGGPQSGNVTPRTEASLPASTVASEASFARNASFGKRPTTPPSLHEAMSTSIPPAKPADVPVAAVVVVATVVVAGSRPTTPTPPAVGRAAVSPAVSPAQPTDLYGDDAAYTVRSKNGSGRFKW